MVRDKVTIQFFRSIPIEGWEEQAGNCVRMWRAIIDQCIEDIINIPRTVEEQAAKTSAEVWFRGTILYDAETSGFADVCDLAQLPPHTVHRKITEFKEVYVN